MFALQDVADHAVDFWLSAEDLPEPENRVTLNAEGQVVLSYTPPNNRQPLEELYTRVKATSATSACTRTTSCRATST